MVKRLFDIVASMLAIVILAPVLLVAALGIRLSSHGPIIYRAQRAGLNGMPFTLHKFRTMHMHVGKSAITSGQDNRVFSFGAWLRRLKIDELPQLFDVLRGKMSIVGPRPEDLTIVQNHFAPEHWETLRVRPGLASPGSIYNYTHGEKLIGTATPENDYLARLLPTKLALEAVYVRNASLAYDFRIIARTLLVIFLVGIGRTKFRDPPELAQIKKLYSAQMMECISNTKALDS